MSGQDLRIETDRLILRPPQPEDFAGWTAFFADPEAARHMGGVRSEASAWRHFLMMSGAWAMQGFGTFSLIDKTTERWVGWCGPWYPRGWPGKEVGWCLAREVWGHGYASEAAAVVLDWVFGELGWDEVIHLIVPDNRASQAVASRLGSAVIKRIEMVEPFAGEMVDIWGQTSEQWHERRDSRR